ncbi:hypothetical protein, partial [Nitrososphaera sp. AFS]|uniref:hypothetical protein n=1 Tax=Nitrososphaera sp. AFS TaxID=2301191 RepID=UPI001F4730D1
CGYNRPWERSSTISSGFNTIFNGRSFTYVCKRWEWDYSRKIEGQQVVLNGAPHSSGDMRTAGHLHQDSQIYRLQLR